MWNAIEIERILYYTVTRWSNRIQSNVNNELKWKINNWNLFNALWSFEFEGCEAWKNLSLLWNSKSNQTFNGFSINKIPTSFLCARCNNQCVRMDENSLNITHRSINRNLAKLGIFFLFVPHTIASNKWKFKRIKNTYGPWSDDVHFELQPFINIWWISLFI